MFPPGISCGAYSVTQGAVSSISPHNHCNNHGQDRMVRDGHLARDSHHVRDGHLARDSHHVRDGHQNILSEDNRHFPPSPDMSEVSYYRYN